MLVCCSFKNGEEGTGLQWSGFKHVYWGSARFYAGATGDGLPVANSVIERDNRGIKDYITCHKRLAMGNFLGAAVEELQFISEETVDWLF